jgi:NADH:ubiquinone oxidoreductase subunit 6 (subunit J)
MLPPWLDRTEQTLVLVLQVLLAVSAAAVLIVGTLMIVDMDASSRSQGGRVYVGIAMLVLLAVIASKFTSVSARRKSR